MNIVVGQSLRNKTFVIIIVIWKKKKLSLQMNEQPYYPHSIPTSDDL